MAEPRLSFTRSLAVPAPVRRLESLAASSPSRNKSGRRYFSGLFFVRALGHGFADGARKRLLFAAGRFSSEQRVQARIAVDRRRTILHEPSSVRRWAVIAMQISSQHP